MDIRPYISNGTLTIKVTPHAGRQEISDDDGMLHVYLKAPPDRNKANLELIKFLKKEFNLRVEIRLGFTSRTKILRILD